MTNAYALSCVHALIRAAPMPSVHPGVLIFLTVIAFNLLGDGLRDAPDPRAGAH